MEIKQEYNKEDEIEDKEDYFLSLSLLNKSDEESEKD